MVPGYTIDSLLGSGGFARVWAGRRDRDGLEVAIKVSRHAQRLRREAARLIRVGTPYVPRVYDTGPLADGRYHVAMERIVGATLAEELESLPDRPRVRWVRKIAQSVLTALCAVHERGLVHCDLKPENIVVVERPRGGSPTVRLVDFGLARGRGSGGRESSTQTRAGTVEYMAPEQSAGLAELDARVDVYAFGVLLYELLTHRPPFVGDPITIEHGHQYLRPPLPSKFVALPGPVEQLVLSCLSKDPARRPPDAAVLARAFERAWSRATPQNVQTVGGTGSWLLVDDRQPAVLLSVDLDRTGADSLDTFGLVESVKARGGQVAWRSGNRYVCVFHGLEVEDPGRAALDTARSLLDGGCARRAAIHLAHLVIHRRRRGGLTVKGAPVSQPESWLPNGDWSGLVATEVFVEACDPGASTPLPDDPGLFAIGGERAPAPLATEYVGHDEVLAAAWASLDACLDVGTPGLFTAIAEPGLGRSRLARELARGARERCRSAQIVSLSATGDQAALRDQVDEALGSAVPGGAPTVLIIDDAHLADGHILDRIELDTANHERVSLWVAITARPRLQALRLSWGKRANRHAVVELPPLDPASAEKLARDLLWPADYPPAEFIDRMVAWTGGSPGLLARLAGEIARRGIIRRRTFGQGFYLAVDAFEPLPEAMAPSQWLAARALADMLPELAACVRVCAVLGASFTRDELAWVQDSVDRYGGAGTPVDADVAVRDLLSLGVLRTAGADRVVFASFAFRDAVHELLAAEDRHVLHGYAREFWRARLADRAEDRSALECFARHAAASGEESDAAQAYFDLGRRAQASHHDATAEAHYSSALRHLGDEAEIRARVLAGRGQVRYRLHRIQGAYDDLQSARAILEAAGDRVGVAELLLEEATAADTAREYARETELTDRAERALETASDPAVSAKLVLARGRVAFRRGDMESACELLTRARELALTGGFDETLAIARTLLAPALVCLGRKVEAERVFDDALEHCERTGNRLHQCSTLANRMYLWSARNLPGRAVEDLRDAMHIAREVGNPEPEHVATHNLAELLYWSGELDEALAVARRARDLQLRFFKGLPFDALLLARIHAARSEPGAAREFVECVETECDADEFEPAVRLLHRTIRLVLGDGAPGDSWNDVVSHARVDLPREELIEILWWRARVAMADEDHERVAHILDEARPLVEDLPIWKRMFGELDDSRSSNPGSMARIRQFEP